MGLQGREAELEAIDGRARRRRARRPAPARRPRRGRHRQDAPARGAARARRGAALRRARGPRDRARARRPARAGRRRARAQPARRRRARRARVRAARAAREVLPGLGARRPPAARAASAGGCTARSASCSRSWPAAGRWCCSSTTSTGPTRRRSSCSSTCCAARPPTRCCSRSGLRPGPAAERLLAARRAGDAAALVALDLRPLERAAAEALLAEVPSPSERDRLYAQSGGNPLLLRELARDGGTHAVPGGIVAAVRREVEALPARRARARPGGGGRGRPVRPRPRGARSPSSTNRPRSRRSTSLEQHGLIAATGDPRRFAFRHPVMRTAVHEALGAGARLAGHAAAARELARSGAPLAVRAQHLAHAARRATPTAAATLRDGRGEPCAARPRPSPRTGCSPRGARTRRRRARGARRDARRGRPPDDRARGRRRGRRAASARMAVAAAGVERLLGRHDAARRRLSARSRRPRPAAASAARVLADLAAAAYLRGEYAEMREWARQIERPDSVDGVVRAAYATLLAVGEAFAGHLEAADAAAAVGARRGRRRRRRRARRRGGAGGLDLLGPAGARASSRSGSPSPGGSAPPPAAPATGWRRFPTTSRRSTRSACSAGWPRPSRSPTRPSRPRASAATRSSSSGRCG